MKIVNVSKNSILADEACIADSFLSRLKGLLGRTEFKPGEGLIIKPCDSIHTFFMHFPIDVVFIDKQNKIIKIYPLLKPWRLSSLFFSAVSCIELPSGILTKTNTQEGDYIMCE